MFLLSCVVRYRPQTWVHVITRTTTQDNPSMIKALALLEEFMTIHSATMQDCSPMFWILTIER